MPWYLPVTLVAALMLVVANATAEEIALLPATGRAAADCSMPAIPDRSNLIVLNGEGAGRRDNLADLPNGLGERINDEVGKSYARAETGPRGYVGPGIDGLRTFYPGDASDRKTGRGSETLRKHSIVHAGTARALPLPALAGRGWGEGLLPACDSHHGDAGLVPGIAIE